MSAAESDKLIFHTFCGENIGSEGDTPNATPNV